MTAIEEPMARPQQESLGRISTAELSKMWRSKYGVDVDRLFLSPEIELRLVRQYGYYRFLPARSGDDRFYTTLMRKLGYDLAEKPEFIEAASQITEDDQVLDVGSGVGNFSARCPGSYRGVDTNPGAVEDAAKLGRNVHLGLVQDEPASSYDVVTAFQVLEHVDDPKGFLDSCVRCLRPGGRILVSTPDMDGVMGSVANDILNYPPHHMSWWSQSSLRAILEDCGCIPQRVWHEPLRRGHLSTTFSALLWPRGEKHLVTSKAYPIVQFASKILARFAARRWDTVPFVKGHAVMVTAKKCK